MEEIASTQRKQAPPPHIIYAELVAPKQHGARAWLQLRPGESRPRVLTSTKPSQVLWSSLFKSRPRDRIRFDIALDATGSIVTWTLLSSEPADADEVRSMKYRINQLINGQMREAFDQ